MNILPISLSAIPLGVAPVALWRIRKSIYRDRSFSRDNLPKQVDSPLLGFILMGERPLFPVPVILLER